MSKLIKFFKAKAAEKKFSHLGTGHVLGNASSSEADRRGVDQSVSTSISHGVSCGTDVPFDSSRLGASKAGEAAMERLNRQNRPRPSSQSAIRRELDEARQTDREAEELRERFKQNVVTVEKPSVLSRVLFWCPSLFGESVIAPRGEVDTAIHDYLTNEAETNLPEAATLILIRGLEYSKPPPQPDVPISEQPTFSEWRDKQKQNFSRILNNLIASPDNATYRRLRMGNPLVRGLLSINGAPKFFQACGFIQQDCPVNKPVTAAEGEEQQAPPENEPFLVISENDARNATHLQMMLELLSTAEPILPTLYRDTKVFTISNKASLFVSQEQLPDEFFKVTKEELKRLWEQQQRIVEESGMLLTKAMRERLRVQEIRLFRYVLIRVRISSDLIIQGTFYAHDTLGTLRTWISDCFATPCLEYQLWAPPGTVSAHARTTGSAAGRVELNNNSATLTELGLAPSSLLNISFAPSVNVSTLLRQDLLRDLTAI